MGGVFSGCNASTQDCPGEKPVLGDARSLGNHDAVRAGPAAEIAEASGVAAMRRWL